MLPVLTLWTKPSCVQCDAVKRRIVDKLLGLQGDRQFIKGQWDRLREQGLVIEHDLTDPNNQEHLNYFKGLGYTSAPITEYGVHLIPGYIPAELDDLLMKWKSDHDVAHVDRG